MNTVKFTLTSTILAAALGLALGLSAPPALANPAGLDGCHDHKVCTGGGGTTFTVQLFDLFDETGAFDFCPLGGQCGPIDVTPNTRGNVLRSNKNLDMSRPAAPDLEATWNAVFNACKDLLGENTVDSFSAGHTDWSVDKAGGVRVVFRDIVLLDIEGNTLGQGAEFRLQLMGDEFDFDDPFLPEPGETSVFELLDFAITGTPERGKGAIKSCRGIAGSGPLLPPSTLVITASAP